MKYFVLVTSMLNNVMGGLNSVATLKEYGDLYDKLKAVAQKIASREEEFGPNDSRTIVVIKQRQDILKKIRERQIATFSNKVKIYKYYFTTVDQNEIVSLNNMKTKNVKSTHIGTSLFNENIVVAIPEREWKLLKLKNSKLLVCLLSREARYEELHPESYAWRCL